MTSASNSRLMVYLRVKPAFNTDQKSIIDVIDDKTLIFDPKDAENEPNNEYFYHGKRYKSIGAKQQKNSQYTFDYVFNTYTTNQQIYELVTRPMIDAAIDGINCSVFAYGATGSGKTYTMLGSPNCPGVIYHTSKDLFGRISSINASDPRPVELKVCYFEIYNEKVRDLLVFEANNYVKCGNKRLRTTPERCRFRQKLAARDVFNLPVCDTTNDGASVIPDLSYHNPTNAEQLIELLEIGNSQRSQHPTEANADSSRSHAIFQIVLTRRMKSDENASTYDLQSSKLSLIDLAGSERASVAYRAGADRSKNLQREGGNINKSLLALGNCINALADQRNGPKHIPYRNSKLTRLLRDSLGGRCKTAMIATVCQQPNHYDDTQNTLMYASRAKCIKLKAGRNFSSVQVQPKNYNLIIDNQTKQIERQQHRIAELEQRCAELEQTNRHMHAELEEYRSHHYYHPNADTNYHEVEYDEQEQEQDLNSTWSKSDLNATWVKSNNNVSMQVDAPLHPLNNDNHPFMHSPVPPPLSTTSILKPATRPLVEMSEYEKLISICANESMPTYEDRLRDLGNGNSFKRKNVKWNDEVKFNDCATSRLVG